MKQNFRDYLTGLGLSSETHQKRLFDLYHIVSRLLPGEIGEVFLSQANEEKSKATGWDSLWFFSGPFCLEARQFLERDDFEIRRLESLRNLRILSENFDLKTLSPTKQGAKASLFVEFETSPGGRCQLHAYGGNCGKLATVLLEYLQHCL